MNEQILFLLKHFHLLSTLKNSEVVDNEDFKVVVGDLQLALETLKDLDELSHRFIDYFYFKSLSLKETAALIIDEFPQYEERQRLWFQVHKKEALHQYCFILKQSSNIEKINKFSENFEKELREGQLI